MRARLLAEVNAITTDQRYGSFSMPVTLGMLLALTIADDVAAARQLEAGDFGPGG